MSVLDSFSNSVKGSLSSDVKPPTFPTGIRWNSHKIENQLASALILLQGLFLRKLYHPALQPFLVGINKKGMKLFIWALKVS